MTDAIADESGFAALTERHRRELHVHCYRMLASFDEAEDAVQETFLRAWRSREQFEGEQFRAWLYRIATNVCLDLLRRRSRQVPMLHSFAEVPWLQPYPDRLLDEVAASDDQPDAVVVERETIELAFLAALQVLPPRQRAALIIRDVLGWPATEAASLLETSVAAANSARQRARATMQEHLPARRSKWSAGEPSAEERGLLERFIDAHERCDAAAAVAIASEDIRISMPPDMLLFDGLASVVGLLESAFGENRDGDWRLVPTQANRMPTAASYLRRPGDSEFRAFKFDVLRIEDGAIVEITTFGAGLVPGLRPSADALTSVHVGAAVAPRRNQPAGDGDRDEDDERSACGPGCVRHADIGRKVENGRGPAADREPGRALSRVGDDVLPHEDEGEPPPDSAPERDPRCDEQPCVRKRRERSGEERSGSDVARSGDERGRRERHAPSEVGRR